MSKILFKNVHLIIDDYREYENGAILFDEDKIIEVYVHSNKIPLDLDVETIDLNNKILMPSFFDTSLLDDKQIIVDPLNVSNIDSNKKIVLGNTSALAKQVNIDYDGFYNLFVNMSGFDYKDFGLVNLAFEENDKYVEIDGSLDKSILNVVYKLIRKDHLILIGDIKSGVKKLFDLKVPDSDILAFSSLNAYRFFNMDKTYGSLIKGKKSKFMIFDDDFNLIKEIN